MTDLMTTHEGQRSAETKLVFVVDDDPVQRRELADYLRYKGIRVNEIGDGALAVSEIERLKPALVLMDYKMPGCDGVRVAKFAQMLSPATMIVLISGHPEAAGRANMTLAYPLPVIHKPLILSQISDFAMNILGTAGVHRGASMRPPEHRAE